MGRPLYKADWRLIEELCKQQCTRDEIASSLGVSHDTLLRCTKRDHKCTFEELRKKWAEGGKCSLRRKQWLLADKNPAMAIFLGKQILNQRDDIRLQHSGEIIQQIVHFGDKVPEKWKDDKTN